MSDHDLEKALRGSLRHVDPPQGFDARVMARIEAAKTPDRVVVRPRWRVAPSRWVPVALAASALIAVLGSREWREQEQEKQGLAARQQLIDALRVTGQKLDLAYRVVNAEPARVPAADDAGA